MLRHYEERKEADDMNIQTRKITEGAMMCAIVGLVLFINRQLGNMLEYFMYWVLTFPILVYTAKYGVRNALVPSVSMLLLSFMISSPTTIFYLFSCIVVGLVYGGGVRKGWKNGTLLVFSGIFTFFSYLVTTVLLAAVFGYDPAEDIELVKTILELMNIHTGIDLMKTVTIIVVLVAVLMSVLQTMCIHMIGNILLSRLHIRVHPMNNILSIRAPKWNGWLILVIWVLFYSGNVLKLNQEASTILLGAYLVCKVYAIACGAMCIMGLLVLLRKRAFVLLLMIAVFVPYVQDVIAVIGIADILFLLRDKMKRGVINGSFGKF